MSVILRLGAVNTETPYSRLVSDGTEYDAPVDMSPMADELYHSPPQTYPGCFGLPYQDHNYGAPPPPTPPQTPPPPPPPPVVKENLDIKEEIVVTSDPGGGGLVPQPQLVELPPDPAPPPPSMQEEDVDDPTRCICDFIHDDGYMIQCDKCSVWQHIVCMGLDRDSIPDTYLCELCHPRPVDRARAREFQIRKREFLKNLLVTPHDSSTDTDPEEVNNRLKAYGLDQSAQKEKAKQKVKMKKRKERSSSKCNNKKMKNKEPSKEKENTNKELNKKNKLLVKDFSSRTAQVKKEKLTKKIEKLRAERISQELHSEDLDGRLSSEDMQEDEHHMINTAVTTPPPALPAPPVVQDENAQTPWTIVNPFNEWEQSYEVAKYNQYTTYVQEYLNSTYINGHHNDIADLVTDGLRVQRCHLKELKHKMKGLQASCAIPDGQPIIEVIGKVMTRQQYDKDNFGQRQLSPFVFFYGKVFDLDLVIDASDYGNDARFIRRSCQANAVVRHVVAGGQAHFITVATREILEGTEITIPFDYDYKKWNFCVECACLRNNCPVSRYQKRRLRFQKLNIDQSQKKFSKNDKSPTPKTEVKSPVKSPTKSPIKTIIRTPEKVRPDNNLSLESMPDPDYEYDDNDDDDDDDDDEPHVPSPTKMVRRSQVPRHTSSNASTQASTGRLRSLRVPSQPDSSETEGDPVSKPEPSSMRSSEVDPLTSPECARERRDSTDKQDTPQEKKKMTREERKMEAIMKAFEKMEKRNARKQSVDHHPKAKEKERDDKKSVKKEPEREVVVKEEVVPKLEIKMEPKVISPIKPAAEPIPPPPQAPVPAPVEPVVKHEVEAVKPEVVPEQHPAAPQIEVKEEEVPVLLVKPEIRHRPPPKGKKAKKAANRRRTRNSSGAAILSGQESVSGQESQEEGSNSSSYPAGVVSCPVTPVPTHEEAASSSSSATPFRFLKTKRHLMNEWLIEKSSDQTTTSAPRPAPVGLARPEPLEVTVQEEESMYVTCLPSPRNSMDRLRRNSQSCGSRDRHSQSVESTGSAKKRWLRQAMGEGSSDAGLASPGQASGGMSPNPQAAAMPSPGGSPPADFVTPLKKRRLARESLSRDSISSESPTPATTPSSSCITPGTATSYFSNLQDQSSVADKLESFRMRNGLNPFFSPVKPPTAATSDGELDSTEKRVVEETAGSSEAQCEPQPEERPAECSVDTNTAEPASPREAESKPTQPAPPQPPQQQQEDEDKEEEKDGVSSCAEMDCSTSYNTGTMSFSEEKHKPISNTDIRSSSEVEERTECSEQISDCDGVKSANSEPDSSDSAGVCSETAMEVECDSGSVQTDTDIVTETVGEVDSTECSGPAPGVAGGLDTSEAAAGAGRQAEQQCDSCNSERLEDSPATASTATSAADKLCTSSSSTPPSSAPLDMVNSSVDVRQSKTSPSVVDSSTDKSSEKMDERGDYHVTNSTGVASVGDAPETSGLEPIPSVSSLEPVSSRRLSFSDHESGLINSTIESVPHLGLSTLGASSTNSSDEALIASAYSTVDTATMPNRHLRFLTDCHINTEMVVDSTTQYLPPSLTAGLANTTSLTASLVNSTSLTAGLPNSSGLAHAYDSDSMDVTSGTDLGMNGSLEDTRKSDDSMSGYPDNSSSRGPAEAQMAKEKKKVSLQEYLKRKKDKPGPATAAVAPTPGSSSSSSSSYMPNNTASSSNINNNNISSTRKLVSSTTAKSPLRLTTNIKLDKLPPLPSLPSLPMFEKTERKEFKSSSDLVSPIFNRKEKTEEVRKPMSLSERLRQEFGLDDSTDTDTDTENKSDQKAEEEDADVPPPPPPPPPQTQQARKMGAPIANGNAIPSLMSLKTYHTPLVKSGDPASAPVVPSSHPQMVPPPFSGSVKPSVGGPTSPMGPSPSKSQMSTIPPSLMNLLSNVKSPKQLQSDLTSQLNALKAQINKVQQSLPGPSSSSAGSSAPPAPEHAPPPPTVNGTGASTTTTKPQVFDYGHQSSASYMRQQNSYPTSTSSSKHHYHGYNKSPTVSYGKASPGYNKLSPGFSKHSPSSAAGNLGYNSHHNNMSPPAAWNQKASSSHKHLSSSSASSSSQRKHFSKQSSHKYS